MATAADRRRRLPANLVILAVTTVLAIAACDEQDVTTPGGGAAPGVTVSDTALSVLEGGDPGGLALALAAAPADTVTVTVSAAQGFVTADPGTLVFVPDAWSVPRTVQVRAYDDLTVQGERADTLAWRVDSPDLAYAHLSVPRVMVTVVDDDAKGVTVTPETLNLIEGGPEGTGAVLLTAPPAADVRLVPLATPDVGLEILPDTLVFRTDTWNLPAHLSVRALADGVDETTPQVAVVAFAVVSEDADYAALVSPTVEVRVSEVAAPYLSVGGSLVTEGDGPATARVALSQPVAEAVRVRLRTGDGTAVAASDYVAVDSVLTLPAGTTAVTVPIAIIDDDLPESGEHLAVQLTEAEHAVIGTGTALCYIQDDDNPAITVDDVARAEGAGAMTFTVTLSTASPLPAGVHVSTVAATAPPGEDYVARSEVVVMPAGVVTHDFTVTLLDDLRPEPDEIFLVALTAPVNAVVLTGIASGTIVDDDGELITVADVTANEADGSAGFAIALSGPVDDDVEITVATVAGDAQPGTDYVDLQETITIPAGETAITVPVVLVDDDLPELPETFGFVLRDAVGAVLDDSTATCTLTDDDLPVVTVADVVEDEDDGPLDFLLGLSETTPWPVTVTVVSLDGTATAPADYTAVARLDTFPAVARERTVAVPLVNDAAAEGEEWFLLQITAGDGAAFQAAPARGTIRDDDLPRVSVGDVVAFENGGSAVLTILLSGASAVDVVMQVDTSQEEALEGVDYVGYHAQLTIAAGRTAAQVIVPLVDDTAVEPDESFRLELSELQNGTFQDASALVTIVDDD